METPEYGARGVVGVLMPPANPTVEPEMAVLLGPDIAVLGARLLSRDGDDRTRLIDYLVGVERTLDCFDTAPLRAVGFGCTSSTYLVGRKREAEILAEVGRRRGYVLLSAAEAVRQSLAELGARRIALLSPYPNWLTAVGAEHWRSCGLTVAQIVTLGGERTETRGIYALGSGAAIAGAAGIGTVDAILISGTGMPSLAALDRLNVPGKPPAIASNLCLAWAIGAALGGEPTIAAWLAPDATWRRRLALLFPAAVDRAARA